MLCVHLFADGVGKFEGLHPIQPGRCERLSADRSVVHTSVPPITRNILQQPDHNMSIRIRREYTPLLLSILAVASPMPEEAPVIIARPFVLVAAIQCGVGPAVESARLSSRRGEKAIRKLRRTFPLSATPYFCALDCH